VLFDLVLEFVSMVISQIEYTQEISGEWAYNIITSSRGSNNAARACIPIK
jgi:hypothetical protein